MRAIDALSKVQCQTFDTCPGVFYVPAFTSRIMCPVCGDILCPENNGRNGGPMLYSAPGETLTEHQEVVGYE